MLEEVVGLDLRAGGKQAGAGSLLPELDSVRKRRGRPLEHKSIFNYTAASYSGLIARTAAQQELSTLNRQHSVIAHRTPAARRGHYHY